MNNEVKAITLTTIFEASALNRDEKIGGNIPSIKKLTRFGNKTFSYLSKVAIRHYLFETLNRLYGDDWKPADCIESGGRDQRVVQFDITKQNIFSHAELDAFGYMFTISGQQGINRKGCVGITKAVALEPWEGDMQFNANHDLARRCDADPNPVNKEEHMSYYKITFTIDVERLGRDEWLIEDYDYDTNTQELVLILKKGAKIELKNVEQKEDNTYFIDKYEIKIHGNEIYVDKNLMTKQGKDEKKHITFKPDYIYEEENGEAEKKGNQKKRKTDFKIESGNFEEDENYYKFVGYLEYNQNKKTLKLSTVVFHKIKCQKKNSSSKYKVIHNNQELGDIEISETQNSNKKKVIFELNEALKAKRICQILNAIKNG